MKRKSKLHKLLSLLLALVMIISAVPISGISVFAAESGEFEYEVLRDGTASITEYFGSATEVVIPETIDGYVVTYISGFGFYKTEDIRKVIIPKSVDSISEYAFSGCIELETINVDKNNPAYCDEDGVLFNKDKTTLVKYPAARSSDTYAIPNSVTTIGKWAFQDGNVIKSITVPNSVEIIEYCAFVDCGSLVEINLPNSINTIEYRAFDGCSSLKSIAIPNSVKGIQDEVFAHCSSLSSITIPDSIKGIGNFAFVSCSSLKSITIPDSVVSILAGALGILDPRGPGGKSALNRSSIYDDKGHLIGFKIYGNTGTAAESYAKEYGFEFIPLNKKTDSATGISISEKEPNIIPDGAELKINKLYSSENKTIVDISLVKDSTEVQPNGEVTVKIPLPEGMNSEICKVYREEADGTFTDMNAYYLSGYRTDHANGYMVFTTDHFSKYIITTTDPSASMPGDINGDGKVTAVDARWVLQIAARTRDVTEAEKISVDLNKDGKVTAVDARWVLQIAAGIRTV